MKGFGTHLRRLIKVVSSITFVQPRLQGEDALKELMIELHAERLRRKRDALMHAARRH